MAKDPEDETCAVTAWNNRSEASYTFGLFKTFNEADAFVAELPDYYTDMMVVLVNPPELAGTGLELH